MNEKMRVNLAELLPIIEEQLKDGKEVCFSPNGVSMLPMLKAGRDSVFLSSPPDKLKKYDLPLYRRENGQFVLHRVVGKKRDGTYIMCGDNQNSRESGIKHSQIVGVVTSLVRRDRRISCRNPIYKMYCIARVAEQHAVNIARRVKRRILKNR